MCIRICAQDDRSCALVDTPAIQRFYILDKLTCVHFLAPRLQVVRTTLGELVLGYLPLITQNPFYTAYLCVTGTEK